MSEPEIKFVVDEYGRIGYRVTNEGVLLSKDEKEFIASHILHLQAENAKLRELVHILAHCAAGHGCDICQINGGEGLINTLDMCESVHDRMRELGVEVDE